MPVTRNWAYFDHAAVAPLPEPTRQAVRGWADHFAEQGVVNWNHWRQQLERVRELLAARLHCDPAEVALIHNTTEGIGLIAEGIRWREGDNVVVPDSEFPSNLFPWLNLSERGVTVRQVAAPQGVIGLDDVAACVDRRTRLIAVSWVGYATGYRAPLDDLADLAHRHQALLFVDAIQGLGVLDLDLSRTPVDFLAADGHKWLLGPEGAGVLFVRRERLDRLRPLGVGWNSVVQAGNFTDKRLQIRPDASRYEGGTHGMVGLLGLGASLELTASIPSDVLSRRLRDVTDACCVGLEAVGGRVVSVREASCWSGILACDFPGRDAHRIRRHCLAAGVVLNVRDGWVRLSPHVYTSADDIDRLLTAVHSAARDSAN
jgi:selenocysteine lyase/cysteine desulfurase